MSVNLQRVGWKNGTLVSKGKVEINGIIYEVEPEQYSGETPLTAENLKAMENNTENAINESELNIIATINEKLRWKSQNVNLSYNQSAMIEAIKSANEVMVMFRISDTSYVPMNYPRTMSGMWLSIMAKSDAATDARGSAQIDFATGQIKNSTSQYVDLAITKILWR